jgi:type II restriction/modification system DNA methylase subunit YeeA
MTPHEFVSKWRGVELKERSASQSHFNDLCGLLGVLDPVTADPHGEWFTFEKGASKTTGGDGWADVWRKGCFAWEYKGRHANLQKAFAQLQQYAVALENPPLLIASDMDLIRVHTNWTNTVQEVHDFTLDDLLDGAKRERLKQAFTDPDAFRPQKTRQALTEETAREFASLAQRLRDRGHEAHQVAHFVNQLVFCMFAEDVGLLPDHLFTKMLEVSRRDPKGFEDNARTLFGAMAKKDGKVGFTAIDWFNGGLFENDHVLPVSTDDIDELIKAARRDWSQIDPSILGTLFERGLDPDKRSQLGAHYTDREKIMMIVRPVIIEPLEAEWAEALRQMTALVENAPKPTKEKLLRGPELAKRTRALAQAEAIHEAFIARLADFRVLDPACGSGNFLYVALRALKDIEHRANLDAEALGLHRGFPRVGPECVLGIELNPYAAELARVSVWIGEIQWMRRNGFDAAKNPILRPLETIECRDAVLDSPSPPAGEGGAPQGAEGEGAGDSAGDARAPSPQPLSREGRGTDDTTRAEWPEAEVIIGNPPFLGGKRMRDELGDAYVESLFASYAGRVPPEADFVAYWVAKAWNMMIGGKASRAGLVTTNSIRGGANRRVLDPIADADGFFAAWSDQPWTVEGAAVRVSLLCFSASPTTQPVLDGRPVERINSDLTASEHDLTKANRLPANLGVAFMGDTKGGAFDIAGSLAREWLALPLNPNDRPNSDVLRPWVNGMDVTRRPADKWIIDFGWTITESEAALYEAPFAYVAEHVKPVRAANKREAYARYWWRHVEPRQGFWRATKGKGRVLVTTRHARHLMFSWIPATTVPDSALIAFTRDDDTFFGVLQSCFHAEWALRLCTYVGVGNDPRYTPSTTFETFAFPKGLTPDIPAADYAGDPRAQKIAAAAARLNELRENWLNPPDLVVREPEVVPGYHDRILPKNEEAAKELKKRTLTNLYNARPQWLANAHAALDEAVAEAYGWGDDWRAGLLTEEEILARLFKLNQERANGQTERQSKRGKS